MATKKMKYSAASYSKPMIAGKGTSIHGPHGGKNQSVPSELKVGSVKAHTGGNPGEVHGSGMKDKKKK